MFGAWDIHQHALRCNYAAQRMLITCGLVLEKYYCYTTLTIAEEAQMLV